MEQGTLKEVLEVERNISELLEKETARVRQWLEERQAAIEEDKLMAMADLEASAARQREEARASAEHEATRIVQEARSAADRSMSLDDAHLRPIVRHHIARILPESDRDH